MGSSIGGRGLSVVGAAGRDMVAGTGKGRLRTDAQAVRFGEVVINGPNAWSPAASGAGAGVALRLVHIKQGTPPEVLSTLLGHTSVAITLDR